MLCMDYGFTDSITRYDVNRMCPSGKAIIKRLTNQQLDVSLIALFVLHDFETHQPRSF